jgi:serine/threonine-protein kinase
LGRALDRRSDLFSMGIILYEITMGQRLFAGGSDLETLERVRKAEIPWPEGSGAKLLPGLRPVIEKSLARDKTERFQSAEEFAEALEACLPQGRRVATAKLAKFFQGVFGGESITAREDLKQGRQTAVAAAERVETISLVAAPRDAMDGAPAKPIVRLQKLRRRAVRALPILLTLIWLGAALGLAWWLLPPFLQDQANQAVPVGPAASAPAPAPALEPVPAPVPAPPEPIPLDPAPTPKLKVASEQADVKKVVEPQQKAVQFGSLQVSATPWGRVTIPGLVGGQETPVVKSNIKVGAYSVVVSNSSMGKTVSTRINIRPGATTVCTADFEGKARIRCR